MPPAPAAPPRPRDAPVAARAPALDREQPPRTSREPFDAERVPYDAELDGEPGRARAASPDAGTRTVSRAKPSTARLLALAIGIVFVAAVAIGVLALKGSSSSTKASTAASRTGSRAHAKPASSTHSSAPAATTAATVPPGETNVVVLNGTETTDLAHQTAAQLSQNGYTQATALGGRPPGENQATVVDYTGGHRAEAEGVAHAIGVSRVQPIESAVSSLSGSATVVVIVGQDKASTAP